MYRSLATVLLALAVALVLSACGSSGDSDTQTVKETRIPFTFDLPKDFKKKGVQQGSSQGTPPIVAYGIDNLNLVDVRQSAAKALPADSVEAQVKASLAQLGFANQKAKREKHNGIEMVAFDIDNKVNGKQTNSKLYFFAGGGGTWELECQSSGDKANGLKDACNTAVDSVKFAKK